MERKENLKRLEGFNIGLDNPHYLHYVSFHKDLKSAILTYAKGDVLDIGCGNKPYESLFGSKSNKYVGVDMIQSHLQKVDIIAPANNIPVEDSMFDTVFSTQVIEHVEDHQGLVNEAFRILKPGGYFILSGPFSWPLHEEPHDFFRFSEHGFRLILNKAGFSIVEITPNGGVWAHAGLSLIHAFEGTKGKNFRTKVLISIYYRFGMRKLINKLFSRLDESHSNTINTINYVIVAKKN